MLIVFEVGCVVVWNLQTRESERFAADQAPTKCVSWHSDGRQFICGHKDGSLTVNFKLFLIILYYIYKFINKFAMFYF